MSNILVVDDDQALRALLRSFLETEGYLIFEAASGTEALTTLETETIDLITLDLNLNGEDGLALARSLRQRWSIPIIMLTAKADDTERIVGLEIGADDYIVKPFNIREVLARVRAVLRRCKKQNDVTDFNSDKVKKFGSWSLNVDARLLISASGEAVQLTTAEFKLLELFVTRPARVLSRDAIMDHLSGRNTAPFDRSIDTLIGRLRKKIEADPTNPVFIKTVHGVGYMFTP
jgi:two-component system, OmpR family, response regulator